MAYILAYHCKTAAGSHPSDLMRSLVGGKVHAGRADTTDIPSYAWPERTSQPYRQQMLDALLECWKQVSAKRLDAPIEKLGIILATTKGYTEDYIWQSEERAPKQRDLLSPLLDDFIDKTKLNTVMQVCVSNACSSSHVALYLAKHWLDTEACEHVLVMSCDLIGPFIAKGFMALKALAKDAQRPFSARRDGLLLGDGAAMILLGTKTEEAAPIAITAVQTVSEGIAATRSSDDGDSLKQCIEELDAETPDLIIAHGTATPPNDRTEDRVYARMYASHVPVTGTKWCIGHTMSASGAIDVIAACESIRNNQSFGLMTSDPIDSTLKGFYQRDAELRPLDKVLVCSLGFGGIQAAIQIERITHLDHVRKRKYRYKTISETLRNLDFTIARDDLVSKVERWNQLDDAAKALILVNEQWSYASRDLIILASPEGSYETDRAFVQSGAVSPSRFIHTLPSTRGSSLLQAMDWQGPVLCIQNGISTVEKAVEVAASFVEHKGWTVQVFSYFSKDFTGEDSGSASVITLQPLAP